MNNLLSYFVHLVDENQRILGLCLLQALDQFAGHRSHVRAPMSFNFRHVSHSAHAETEVLPIQGARNRFG